MDNRVKRRKRLLGMALKRGLCHTLSLGLLVVGLLGLGCGWLSQPAAASTIAAEISVYHSPTCHCCRRWIRHLQAAGFHVDDQPTAAVRAIKRQHGLPENLSACHTAVVNGYIIEGHIPPSDVQRLLRTQPDITGIAVPGMPEGSPGMEAGGSIEPYTVFSFTEDGAINRFAEHF